MGEDVTLEELKSDLLADIGRRTVVTIVSVIAVAFGAGVWATTQNLRTANLEGRVESIGIEQREAREWRARVDVLLTSQSERLSAQTEKLDMILKEVKK